MKPVIALLITLACYFITLRVQKFEVQREARLVIDDWEQTVLDAGGRKPTRKEKRAMVNLVHFLRQARIWDKVHTLHIYPASQTNLNALVPLINKP